MGGAAKFALGILLLWLGMVCFFFAFHPNGVTLDGEPVKNPVEALQWLIEEFQKVTGGSGSSQNMTDSDTGNSQQTTPNNANASTGG